MADAPKLIRADGSADLTKVRAEIVSRMCGKLSFINSYEDTATRAYWSRSILRQITASVCDLARSQQTAFVCANFPVVYTTDELARLNAVSWANPATIGDNDRGSPEYRAARGEADRIRKAARARRFVAFRHHLIEQRKQRRAA